MAISRDKLKCLFYLLMRDEVPVGILRKIIRDIQATKGSPDKVNLYQFSDKHLEMIASKLLLEFMDES